LTKTILGTKFGQSVQCVDRTERQGHSFAYMAADLATTIAVVPKSLVLEIASLQLPAPAACEGREDPLHRLICLQIGEFFLACSRDCTTGTVGERLFALPCDDVKAVFADCDCTFTDEDIEFMAGIPNAGIPNAGMHFDLTWATLPHRMHRRAERSDFVRHKLFPEPPKRGFATNCLLMEATGEKCGGFKDAVPIAPRKQTVFLGRCRESFTPLGSGNAGQESCTTSHETVAGRGLQSLCGSARQNRRDECIQVDGNACQDDAIGLSLLHGKSNCEIYAKA